MNTQSLCLSYDISDGKYDELYHWLSSLGALECCNSVAYIPNFPYDESVEKSFLDALKENVPNVDRAYIVYQDKDKHMVGQFIIGNRKQNPWDN